LRTHDDDIGHGGGPSGDELNVGGKQIAEETTPKKIKQHRGAGRVQFVKGTGRKDVGVGGFLFVFQRVQFRDRQTTRVKGQRNRDGHFMHHW
jgi:hypothetical protein